MREAASWKERVQAQRSIPRQPSYTQGEGNGSILGFGQRERVRLFFLVHIREQFGFARVLILLRLRVLILPRICSNRCLLTRDRRYRKGNPPKKTPDKLARGRELEGLGSPVPTSREGETVIEAQRVIDRRESPRRPWARLGP